jgi:hypothetical protein
MGPEAAMDWNFAIERHREALKRVLAALVAMAGLDGFTSPHPELVEGAGDGTRRGEAETPAVPGEGVTLPRHLHRAVLRLLRPAEAAARRLIIVAARGIEMPRLPPRSVWSASPATVGASSAAAGRDPGSSLAKQRGPGRRAGDGGSGTAPSRPTRLAFPLFDPPRCLPRRRLRASRTAMPRISVPGWTEPAPLPVPPAPDDEIDATRLALRLAALARVLDDLPREARRFARWRARGTTGTQDVKTPDAGRLRRVWPLRHGRPPGQRPPSSRRPAHAVHRILDDVHGLAFDVLNAPDTS